MGLPPPSTSKNKQLKFRSRIFIVIPPAKTGRESTSKNLALKIVHVNGGHLPILSRPSARLVADKKLTLAAMLLTPLICSVKMVASTGGPGDATLDRGGFRVHPLPAPPSKRLR